LFSLLTSLIFIISSPFIYLFFFFLIFFLQCCGNEGVSTTLENHRVQRILLARSACCSLRSMDYIWRGNGCVIQYDKYIHTKIHSHNHNKFHSQALRSRCVHVIFLNINSTVTSFNPPSKFCNGRASACQRIQW